MSSGGTDRFSIEPLVRAWSATYDLVVRLIPDIALRADGIRSTSDAFRAEIEGLLDANLPRFVRSDRLVTVRASEVTEAYDWWPVAEMLAAIVGEPLLADGVPRHRTRRQRAAAEARPGPRPDQPQLALDLDED